MTSGWLRHRICAIAASPAVAIVIMAMPTRQIELWHRGTTWLVIVVAAVLLACADATLTWLILPKLGPRVPWLGMLGRDLTFWLTFA